ncbi:PaaI family thioesterase [Sphingobium sp. H39-3-25]|uniref:PaaI family thioesterase n=1 Tax=Sphingobium arseniciresistens TaxID=3030834 RepID=UPI0023B97B66|nr:PaaI family thioesterase [Sphingobium arseniciresistens]
MSADNTIVRRVTEGARAGWLQWMEPVEGTFLTLLGDIYSHPEGESRAVVELEPRSSHLNRQGALHGGFLASFADHAYFSAMAAIGRPAQASAVTVDLSMQYLSAGTIDEVLRAEVELLGETGRLLFLRMTLKQGDRVVAASTATLRKAPEGR